MYIDFQAEREAEMRLIKLRVEDVQKRVQHRLETTTKTVERIVRSLQARGFLLWFDLDLMKGNTMEQVHKQSSSCLCFRVYFDRLLVLAVP